MHARNADMQQIFDCLVLHPSGVKTFTSIPSLVSIFSSIHFTYKNTQEWIMHSLWPFPSPEATSESRLIEQYENCWIFGDLNYRLAGTGIRTRQDILDLIKAKGVSLYIF